MKHIFELIKKEFLLDFKQPSGFLSVFVYLVAVLFSSSVIFKNQHTAVSYVSLYLIIFIFTAIISSHRNFIKDNSDNGFFNYLIYSPERYIFSKIIYAVLLNMIISIVLLMLFILFNGYKIENMKLFLINIIGLSIGLGSLLSLMSGLSSKAEGNFALMSIMSFPLLLPLIILSSKLAMAAVNGLPISMNIKYIVSLYALDVIVLVLAGILFPSIWID